MAYEPDASHTGVRVTCAFQRGGGDSSDNSCLWFALEIAGATDRDARVTYGYVNTDAGAATATVRGCGLASRMAADGSTAVLVYVAHAVTYFSTYACLRLSDGDNASTAPTRIVAARTMPTICAGLPSGACRASTTTRATTASIVSCCRTASRSRTSQGSFLRSA